MLQQPCSVDQILARAGSPCFVLWRDAFSRSSINTVGSVVLLPPAPSLSSLPSEAAGLQRTPCLPFGRAGTISVFLSHCPSSSSNISRLCPCGAPVGDSSGHRHFCAIRRDRPGLVTGEGKLRSARNPNRCHLAGSEMALQLLADRPGGLSKHPALSPNRFHTNGFAFWDLLHTIGIFS